jgi:hypothetical protein
MGCAADRCVLAERCVLGAFAAGGLMYAWGLRDHTGCCAEEERQQA